MRQGIFFYMSLWWSNIRFKGYYWLQGDFNIFERCIAYHVLRCSGWL